MADEVEVAPRPAVQELSETGRGPPARYIQSEENRPMVAPTPSTPVPVVDLHRLFEHDAGDEFYKLKTALQSWGLFQAIGHGLSASFLDEVRNAARKFFLLPMDVKKKYSNSNGKEFVEGYGNDLVATEDQTLDWSDRLYLLVEPEDERKLDLWPEDPISFRDILHEYTMKTRKVVEHLLKSMAKLLELDEGYFLNQLGKKAAVYARFNYYPCCLRPDLVFGIKPHSDGSVLTILLPDKNVDGLQILKDINWVKVPIIPHALIVNMGDQMEVMSNGIFKSPVHRVVTNSQMERISVAMFYALEPEKELKPADGLIDETRPRLYKTMGTKDYLNVFFQRFLQGKRAIDWAKI